MKWFGNEKNEMDLPPFLIKTIEDEDSGVRFVIALSVRGEAGSACDKVENKALNEVLQRATPIYPDENNLYEIVFDDYVFHMTRNESYTAWDDYEVRKGKYFIVFERSRLLDCMPKLVETELVEAYFPQGWKHYGIYCQNHIIDVIAAGEPRVTPIHKQS